MQDQREKHRENIKKSILESAKKIAKEEGWNSLTMRKISKEIGFSLPIIYRNFKNKDAIISFLANQGFVDIQKEISKVMQTKFSKPSTLIQEVIKTYWNFSQKKSEIYSIMYGLEGITFEDPYPLKEAKKLFYLIQEWIQSLIDDFQAKIENSLETTEMIWAGVHGFIALSKMQKIERSKERSEYLLKTYCDYFIKAWGLE